VESYTIEWDGEDILGALDVGFHYLEMKDQIVRFLYASPTNLKRIILASPGEVNFDYIPDGIGYFRTAYLLREKMRDGWLKLLNQERTVELRIVLK